ncbi:MAG: hypothetical protein H0W33_00120 [Gammaproteobacteria bacterium]|nr:hypothetical protein [Gammaproteobacteria bacterium]
MAKPELSERQQYWLEHITAADASDGTLVAYAAAHELNVKDLYQWKTAFARRGVLPGKAGKRAFVRVATPPPPAAALPTSCSITLPNGVRLQVAGALDATMLGEVLTAASSVS